MITNDEYILEEWHEGYGAFRMIRIYLEPEELAMNHKHIDAILWGLQGVALQDDIILLQPTNPYRTRDDINYFIDVYMPPFNVVAVDPTWKTCGAIYIIKYEDILEHKSFHTPLTRYIPLPYPNYLDINEEEDFEEAKMIYRLIERGDLKIE